MISLFGGWIAVVVLAGLYYLLAGILSPLAYLLCAAVLLMVLAVILLSWLQTRGGTDVGNTVKQYIGSGMQ